MGVLNVTPDSFSDGGRYLDARCSDEASGRAHRRRRGHRRHRRRVDADRARRRFRLPSRSRASSTPSSHAVRRSRPRLGRHDDRRGRPLRVCARRCDRQRRLVPRGRRSRSRDRRARADRSSSCTRAGTRARCQASPWRRRRLRRRRGGRAPRMVRRAASAPLPRASPEPTYVLDPGLGFMKNALHSLTLIAQARRARRRGRPGASWGRAASPSSPHDRPGRPRRSTRRHHRRLPRLRRSRREHLARARRRRRVQAGDSAVHRALRGAHV